MEGGGREGQVEGGGWRVAWCSFSPACIQRMDLFFRFMYMDWPRLVLLFSSTSEKEILCANSTWSSMVGWSGR